MYNEVVVQEVLVAHVAPEYEHQANHLQVVIIVHIMTDLVDYILVIQVIKILEVKVPGILEQYLH